MSGLVVEGASGETPNDLAYWYPKVASLVPTPATWIVRTDLYLLYLVDGVEPPGFEAFVDELRRAGDEAGWPCFLRTGHGSGKHDWKHTCFVTGPEEVPAHVAALVEWSAMADFFGLPTSTWAVRELLSTAPAFTAFYGKLPITKERRYFVVDGTVVGHHPYWPPAAIEHASDPEWMSKLEELNQVSLDYVPFGGRCPSHELADAPGIPSSDPLRPCAIAISASVGEKRHDGGGDCFAHGAASR